MRQDVGVGIDVPCLSHSLRLVTVNATELVELSVVRLLARSGAAKAIHLAAGLSLPQVAEAVGVKSPTTVYLWEEGLRAPSGLPALRYRNLLEDLQRGLDPRSRPKSLKAAL